MSEREVPIEALWFLVSGYARYISLTNTYHEVPLLVLGSRSLAIRDACEWEQTLMARRVAEGSDFPRPGDDGWAESPRSYHMVMPCLSDARADHGKRPLSGDVVPLVDLQQVVRCWVEMYGPKQAQSALGDLLRAAFIQCRPYEDDLELATIRAGYPS